MLFRVPLCASISGGQPSRTYYQVLDISPDEYDPRVIEEAALGCSAYVRAYQLTCESECTLRLNEIAQALITLLDPNRRREYDRSLGKPSSPAGSKRLPCGRRDDSVLLRGKSVQPPRGKGVLVFLLGDRGACDVKLVYPWPAMREASHWTD